MTLTIQIGNSDDKLTQRQWANFVESVAVTVEKHASATHFFGASAGWMPWQNVCWVIECSSQRVTLLRADLAMGCAAFGQDSIAFTTGTTEFITGVRDDESI